MLDDYRKGNNEKPAGFARQTVFLGFVLTVVMVILIHAIACAGRGKHHGIRHLDWWNFCFRWLHIICGVMWIGLLWYFNFTQTPTCRRSRRAEARHRQVHPPDALFWFRWGAMATIVTGLILAWLHG